MIPLRRDKLINNNVEYLPATKKYFAENYYGISPDDCENDSEKSYEPLYGTKGSSSGFVFLSFRAMWSLIAAITTTFIYTLLTYREFFDENVIIAHSFVILVYFSSCCINLIDISSSTLHFFSSGLRDMEVYKRKSLVLIIIDFLSIAATITDMGLYITRPGNGVYTKIVLALVTLREYRLVQYFRTVTRSPLWQGRMHVLIKYMLLTFVINHSAACVWKLIACYNCNDGIRHWNENFDSNTSPSSWYIICLFNALDSSTTMGLLGGSPRNNDEFIVTLILMIYSMVMNTGVFLGAFTELQIESNKRRALYASKLRLIKKDLSNDNVSEKLKNSVITWYVNFWVMEHAVTKCDLLWEIPNGFIRNVKFDKYFTALNTSHYLRELHNEVKVALSLKMYTTYFNKGDIILKQNRTQQGMIYIATGVVQLVSPDDVESPIIMFEYGTSIGSTSFLYPIPLPAHLVATTYCHVYNLRTVDFWRTLQQCYKLKPSPPIIRANNFIMNNARGKHQTKLETRRKKRVDKTLKLVKDILKKKGRCEITEKLSENNLLGVYQISKGVEVITYMDNTFLSSTFPWILYDNCLFCTVWDYVVVVIATVVIVTYPYFLFYLSTPPSFYYQFLRPVAYTAFAIDVIIQLCTSTVDEHQQLISTLSEIMTYRFGKLMFLIDVLSITPFEVISLMRGADLEEQMAYIECNHMLKVCRVFKTLVNITQSLQFKGKLVRIVFYIICLLYFGYLQGIIYYKAACPQRPCNDETWVTRHMDYVLQHNSEVQNSNDYVLLVAVYNGIMLLTGTAGVTISDSINEKTIFVLFCASYMYLFTYLLADYSATLTLDAYIQNDFRTEVQNLSKFMHVANIDKSIILRMYTYMETMYVLSKTKTLPMFLDDTPDVFTERINVEKTLPFVSRLPLFKEFSLASIRRVLGKVKYETYPANEHVVYAGDRSFNMYVIQQGYCEITRVGLQGTKIIGPNDNIGIFEMLLALPMLHSIRTVTNVKLFYLNIDDFKEIFHTNEKLKKEFQFAIEQAKSSMAVIRTFTAAAIEIDLNKGPEEVMKKPSSFIKFKAGKLDPKTIDLHQGWEGYSMLSFIMLKRTIRPDSTFIYAYVLLHAIVAYMSAILYPSLFILECILPWYTILLLSIPWDLLCLIDVYLRLHVCYYNSSGLLVSHPRCTAAYYLKHSFAVDFFTALPLKLVLDSMMSKKISAFLVLLVKVIRAYRIPNGFAYFRRDTLKNPPTYLLILHYLTLSLVFWNAIALGLVLISVELSTDKNGNALIQPQTTSWFYTKANSEITFEYGSYAPPLKLYLLALYYTTSISLQMNLDDIIMIRHVELLYIILTVISGYIWFTYILVIIGNTKAVYNDNLTKYKNNLKDLYAFMRAQQIPRFVKNRNIRHYEYIYQRNQGYRDKDMFKEFHPTLKKDCQWEMYSSTLLRVPIFTDMDLTFYHKLCDESRIVYYLENNNILCVNDVINWVYIICRGGVQVYSSSESPLCVLTQGAIFGNLDNVEYSRSMLRYTTVTTADVLCIETSRFYQILQQTPNSMHSLKWVLTKNNYFYIESSLNFTHTGTRTPMLTSFDKFLMSTWIKFLFMIVSFLSYQLALYHVAFYRNTIEIYVVSYLLDFLHLVKVYFIFHTPYVNDVGAVIIAPDQIRKRLWRKPTLYIDVLALIPLEIFALACPRGDQSIHYYIAIFRLNRVIRFLNIKWSIKVTHDYLHLNQIIIQVLSMFIDSSTYLHFLACVWYVLACPNGVCGSGSWIYNGVTNQSNCHTSYLCAVYYVTSLVSSAGFPPFVPRTILEILLSTITVVLSKFVTTLLVANMAGLVRHFGYRLQHYTEKVNIMRTYFKNAHVSPQLTNNVLKYIERLWLKSSGVQMPKFLDSGPTLLNEEMKIFAFGAHIFSNPVFRDCHNDFLRLLTTHTKLVRHFLGDVICNQGEINDTMYFIHWGQVEVLCISDKLEVQVDLLTQLDCFGMIQGLFPNTPHSHQFRAKSNAEIVTLRLTDWMQILAFYPAAKFHIYKTIRDHHTLFTYIRNPTG